MRVLKQSLSPFINNKKDLHQKQIKTSEFVREFFGKRSGIFIRTVIRTDGIIARDRVE